MTGSDKQSTARAADARHPTDPQRTGGPPPRTPARRVDPYDMRPEPQPEEPGYGHGV